MAGTGVGPSRRSHTKSRKGCKTCKRRHIRCDEKYPQCQNCTKHQVRCDYMDSQTSDTEESTSPEQTNLSTSPMTEARIDLWQQTGHFPYPNLQVFPPPQPHEYPRNDLRLINHLAAISNDLLLKGTSGLTIWTEKMPKFLSIASTYPYVKHSLLSFSAHHVAWVHNSSEARNMYLHHGSIALGGLHEAIGSFSDANADAVLAASLLLLWQATDYRSWLSLQTGIQSVLALMRSLRHESVSAKFFVEEGLAVARIPAYRGPIPDIDEWTTTLQTLSEALQRLRVTLADQVFELNWAMQLEDYIHRLQNASPPQSPEEEFKWLYQLRKWLFWIPVVLLQHQNGQPSAMITLAYFYATALALQRLFPALGSSFCAGAAVSPLERIIHLTEAMQTRYGADRLASEITQLMQFPRQAVRIYRSQTILAEQRFGQHAAALHGVDPRTLTHTNTPLSSQTLPPPGTSSVNMLSSQPYMPLDVQHWGTVPSPMPSPARHSSWPEKHEEYGLGWHPDAPSGENYGFVPSRPAATAIWT